MRAVFLFVVLAGAAAVALACTGEVTASGDPADTPGPGSVTSSELPCDVANLLGNHCLTCHGSPPAKGVPLSLASLADLKATSPSDPNLNAAQASVVRMRDAVNPMPPTGQLPANEIDAFEQWVQSGMPQGSCQAEATPATLVCTSQQHWSGGNEESPLMRPGGACIHCHETSNEGPPFRVAGTVYPTVREPNDCEGMASITVQVRDGQGREISLTTNAAGNFYYEDDPEKFVPPFRASVSSNGKTLEMKDAVPSGDCNSCHTQDGANGAPGRIVAP